MGQVVSVSSKFGIPDIFRQRKDVKLIDSLNNSIRDIKFFHNTFTVAFTALSIYFTISPDGTVIFLSFRTDRPGQTVQTKIRLLLSSLIKVYAVCSSLCIFWMNYSKETPSCSTFRVITTNSLGVWIFRKFTVSVIPLVLYHFNY